MSGIKATDTGPELAVRKGLHRGGFRYRLHDRRLPGRPDLVFPKHGAVIFVNGCFWHGHDCQLFKWPKTRSGFWREKILGNKDRDRRNHAQLLADGWRVGHVWECALKGNGRWTEDQVVKTCAVWLGSTRRELVIQGN